jgi:hypothetical protein
VRAALCGRRSAGVSALEEMGLVHDSTPSAGLRRRDQRGYFLPGKPSEPRSGGRTSISVIDMKRRSQEAVVDLAFLLEEVATRRNPSMRHGSPRHPVHAVMATDVESRGRRCARFRMPPR